MLEKKEVLLNAEQDGTLEYLIGTGFISPKYFRYSKYFYSVAA
jgi:hypothetical protein